MGAFTAGAHVIGVASLLENLDDLVDMFAKDVKYIVQATAYYAEFVEMGTSRMDAQPFMGPAADNARRTLSSIARSAGPTAGTAGIVLAVALEVERYAKEVVAVKSGYLQGSIRTREYSTDIYDFDTDADEDIPTVTSF